MTFVGSPVIFVLCHSMSGDDSFKVVVRPLIIPSEVWTSSNPLNSRLLSSFRPLAKVCFAAESCPDLIAPSRATMPTAARIAIIKMTTSNSINVNPLSLSFDGLFLLFLSLLV